MRIAFITIAVSMFLILLILQQRWPLRQLTHPWLKRVVINIYLAIPMFLVAALLVRPVGWHTVSWSTQHAFGLLRLIALPGWLQFILGFLLLDLSFYYWHWLNHRVPLLWRFHNVHHVDPDLDVTTSIRFHVIEVGYSTFFRLLQISLIGINPLTFIVYELFFQLSTFFQHSNLRLPISFERILNKLLVTPRMHGIHHSQIKRELNSNFSVVFSFWDRCHNTLRLNIAQQEIKIGVPGYDLPAANHFWHLLILPFMRQRDYWRLPNGKLPQRSEDQSKPVTFLRE